MGQFGIGQPVRRFEDKRLLTGNGRFQHDVNLPGQAHGFVLRSPHAHARIRVDRPRRRRARRPACWRSIPARISRRPGSARWGCRSSASGRTGRRCSGGRIAGWPRGGCAMSASRSRSSSPRPLAQARDAAELIDIDYEILPSVTDTARGRRRERSRSGTNAPTTSRTCSRPATRRRPTPPSPGPRMSSSAAT